MIATVHGMGTPRPARPAFRVSPNAQGWGQGSVHRWQSDNWRAGKTKVRHFAEPFTEMPAWRATNSRADIVCVSPATADTAGW